MTDLIDRLLEQAEMLRRNFPPQQRYRANAKTINLIGKELANRSPISCLPTLSLDGSPKISTSAQLSTLYGIEIEVDETVPDGWIKPAWPKLNIEELWRGRMR